MLTIRLDYSNRRLTELPSDIGKLVTLRELYCQNNQLTSLPDSISRLTNLEILDYRNNHITELPPGITTLVNLRELSGHTNDLTHLPVGIGKLTNLERLNCGDNRLAALPISITTLPKLRRFWYRGNPLNADLLENHNREPTLPSLVDLINMQYPPLPVTLPELIERRTAIVTCPTCSTKTAEVLHKVKMIHWPHRIPLPMEYYICYACHLSILVHENSGRN